MLSFVSILLFASAASVAAPVKDCELLCEIQTDRFEVGAVAAIAHVGSSQSPLLAWAPYVDWVPQYHLGLYAGLMNFSKSLGGRFFVLETLATARRGVAPRFDAELGAGGQFWISYGGFQPELSAAIDYRFEKAPPGWLAWIERVRARYAYVFIASNPVSEISLAAGFTF